MADINSQKPALNRGGRKKADRPAKTVLPAATAALTDASLGETPVVAIDQAANAAPKHGSAAAAHHETVPFAELLFFAYRDFTTDADAILLEYGFGRAHHRVLHFVTRSPGLRIADLLQILKITKQSLARVLRQLLDEDIITQRAGSQDRRERLLYATEKGAELAARLAAMQSQRIENALQKAGPEAEQTVKRFLFNMIKRADQKAVDSFLSQSAPLCTSTKGNNGQAGGDSGTDETKSKWDE